MNNYIKHISAGLLAVGISATALAASFEDLTYGYDVFVKNDLDLSSGNVHMHGFTAAGGDVYARDSEFKMDNLAGTAHALLAGGELFLTGNQSKALNSGSVRIGTQGPLGINAAGNRIGTNNGGDNTRLELNGAVQTSAETFGPSGIDFNAAFSALADFSTSLAGLANTLNPAAVLSGNRLNFTSATNAVEVFNLSASDFGSFAEIDFSGFISGASKLIINVDLNGFAGAFAKNIIGDSNTPADNVLWNFYGATDLMLQNQFTGSVLAAGIDVLHQNNDLKGSVVANSFTKQGGQVHVHRFDYEINEVPDAGSSLLLALIALPALFAARRRFR